MLGSIEGLMEGSRERKWVLRKTWPEGRLDTSGRGAVTTSRISVERGARPGLLRRCTCFWLDGREDEDIAKGCRKKLIFRGDTLRRTGE